MENPGGVVQCLLDNCPKHGSGHGQVSARRYYSIFDSKNIFFGPLVNVEKDKEVLEASHRVSSGIIIG